MSIEVQCTLVLQAADSGLPPGNPPTASAYPNRIVAFVPPELAPLVSATTTTKLISSSGEYDYYNLASGLIAALGSAWVVESSYYTRSKEQSGGWVSGSGYSYRFKKNGAIYQDPLTAVGSTCYATYLLSMQPVS